MSSQRPISWDANLDGEEKSSAKRAKIVAGTITNQHPQASLLGLPVELRLRIYQHLLGNKVVHITTRPCKPYDKGAFRPNALLTSWGPISRAWKKWTHTICQVPDDWEREYALSKRDHDLTSDLDGKHQDYYSRHDACSWIQDDFQNRKYNFACSHRQELGHRPHSCLEQEEHAAKLTAKYGQADEGGLERCHSGSKLHLEILSVCRQIYNEAALIPYKTNVFSFDYPAEVHDFVAQSAQAKAIQNLHTGSWPMEDLAMAAKALPGLRYLRYSGDAFLGRNRLTECLGIERVEVILDDLELSSCGGEARRREVEAIERALRSGAPGARE